MVFRQRKVDVGYRLFILNLVAMNKLVTVGRIIFAVAIVSLGLEHFVAGAFPVALLRVPAGLPGRFVLAILMGIAFVGMGLSIGFLWKARRAALGLGLLFLLLMFGFHLPALLTNLANGSTWTVVGELMALSGGSFYLAGSLAQSSPGKSRLNWVVAGRLLVAISLFIFGVLHFVYASYIATLIPSWIPAPVFWAYFVGVAFVGTALSLVIHKQQPLALSLLGVMFFLWVVILHAPRVIKNPQIEPEWTSLLIALAMSGIGFLMAGFESQKLATPRTGSPTMLWGSDQ